MIYAFKQRSLYYLVYRLNLKSEISIDWIFRQRCKYKYSSINKNIPIMEDFPKQGIKLHQIIFTIIRAGFINSYFRTSIKENLVFSTPVFEKAYSLYCNI